MTNDLGRSTAIYDWGTTRGYLLRRALPLAAVIEARPDDDPAAVLSRLPRDVTRFAFHLDLSFTRRFPLRRRALVGALERRGVQVLNAAVVDIRKSTLQRRCRLLGLGSLAASRRGEPMERLIVKTVHNYGGRSERRLSRAERAELGLEPPTRRLTGPMDYRILRRHEVPLRWWDDPGLVFERYVCNRWHRFHRVYVLGASAVVTTAINPDPIKKMRIGIRRRDVLAHDLRAASERGGARPDLLAVAARFREGMSLDFGTFEITESDEGSLHVIDVTTTPYWGDEDRSVMIEHLRTGLHREWRSPRSRLEGR